jgi:hypothetical protein
MATNPGTLYWANQGAAGVSSAPAAGGAGRDLFKGGAEPKGLTLDLPGNRVWWVGLVASSAGTPTVYWCGLDGSGPGNRELPQPFSWQLEALEAVTGVAVEPGQSPRLYWVQKNTYRTWTSETISYYLFSTEPGSWPRPTAIKWGEEQQNLLALDPGRNIYVAEQGGILRIELPSTSKQVAVGASNPFAVAVDTSTNTGYWSNGTSILYGKLEPGASPQTLAVGKATVNRPAGIAYDAETKTLYWANQGDGNVPASLAMASVGSGGGENIGVTGATLNRPGGLALLTPPVVAKPPTIVGAGIVGRALACEPGACAPDTPAGLSFRALKATAYQWYFEGKPISGATTPKLDPEHEGNYLCEVTYSNAAGATQAKTKEKQVEQPE